MFQETGKCAVVKTSTRQTFFLPVIGLVPQNELTPGDLVGVNKVRNHFDAKFPQHLIGPWLNNVIANLGFIFGSRKIAS